MSYKLLSALLVSASVLASGSAFAQVSAGIDPNRIISKPPATAPKKVKKAKKAKAAPVAPSSAAQRNNGPLAN